MKKGLLILSLLLFYGSIAFTQKQIEYLSQWAEKSPIEKVYLHTDRENYFAGETAWLKAYLYSGFYPDTISTSLYVELFNESASLVSRKILPIIYGNTKGQIELADSLRTGIYIIRAYSQTMLNHEHDYLYEKKIYVVGKNSTTSKKTPAKSLRIDFFPESGNFVTGFPNTIAFKVSGGNELTQKYAGNIKNEKGEIIASFDTYHEGLGMFDLKPVDGEQYYVQLNNDPFAIKYYLPEASNTGIVFRLLPNNGGNDFELYQRQKDTALRAGYIICQIQHRPVLKIDLNVAKNDITGFINTQQLRSGIMQVTVFSQNGLPLAERICFINNKEYVQRASLLIDTVGFSSRSKNRFFLSFPDTVGGSFSVSITDLEYTAGRQNDNIISSLLLTSDLKGEINDPMYYFSSDQDSVATALDILMMTHGWRRFKWTALQEKIDNPLKFKDEQFIKLSGKVNIRDTKKPLTEKQLVMMLFSLEDSLNTGMQFLETDKQGRYRLDSMIFFGKTRFFVSDIQGRKNKWLDIYPDEDSLKTSFGLRPINTDIINSSAFNHLIGMNSKFGDEYEDYLKSKGLMMEGITLRVKKKTPVQELEERYASGLFAGLTEKTIDLVNTNEKIYQNNIFDYIQGRVPGIKVEKSGLNYTLFYRQRFSITGGPIPMSLYLNEMQSDSRFIATIPANQIAMIKVYSSFVGAEGNGVGGVLAVYTKQSADLTSDLTTSADIFQYKGYSIIKEFYVPDYSIFKNPAIKESSDHRITLHWMPDIIADGVNEKIPIEFYNNDRSKQFKVIVEGMTADGKLVYVEKIISPEKKGF